MASPDDIQRVHLDWPDLADDLIKAVLRPPAPAGPESLTTKDKPAGGGGSDPKCFHDSSIGIRQKAISATEPTVAVRSHSGGPVLGWRACR